MSFEFYMPHAIMRDIAAASIESYLPVAPNFARVTYTGGARNVVGEYTGRTESLEQFRAKMSTTENRRQRETVDSEEEERTLFYLFVDEVDGTDYGIELTTNDLVRDLDTGEEFEVTEVVDAVLGDGKAFGKVKLIGPKNEPA